MNNRLKGLLPLIMLASPIQATLADSFGFGTGLPMTGEVAWWYWPVILLFVSFVMGVLAVLSGIGGGVLYVPIVSAIFPFHLDFARATGLLVALSGSLAAGPGLLKLNLASLRLAIPLALCASVFSIAGALVGLALPTRTVELALGCSIIGICILLLTVKRSDATVAARSDRLSSLLRIHGIYFESWSGEQIDWRIHRSVQGLMLFALIGFLTGMFGLGAGWANVPVLNLILGVPLKISVATSKFLLSITSTGAAWVYLNHGAILPLLVVPSLAGIMLGSFVGVQLLKIARPSFIRWMVILILSCSGVRVLARGLGY